MIALSMATRYNRGNGGLMPRGSKRKMGARGSLTPTRNRWFRILGVSFIMYVLSFIDRTNIAMATPGIRADLGISATEIGFATGTFFWGYVVLQIPAGRISSVW